MILSLDLAKKISCSLPKVFFQRVAYEALWKSGNDAITDANVTISVALVSLDEIRDLNKTYRGKNRPTDVLSFGNFRRSIDVAPEREGNIDLGELVLSPEYIEAAAREDRVSFETEMAYVFSHGVFHLLGFRHCPKMFALQDEIAARYGQRTKMRQSSNKHYAKQLP